MNVMRSLGLTVYVLSDADGEALYVGITSNVSKRLAAHMGKDWGDEIRHIELHPMPEDAIPYVFEMSFIDTLKPRHNVETRWKAHYQTENPCHFVRYCGAAAVATRAVNKVGNIIHLPVCDDHRVSALRKRRYGDRAAA